MFNFSLENILHSNLINFLVMLVLLIFALFKFNIVKILDDARIKVKNELDKSDKIKQDSIDKLNIAQEKFDNSEFEVQKIVQDAEKIADDFIKNAELEAQKIVENIELDANSMYEREVLKIEKNLSKETSEKILNSARLKLEKAFQDESIQEKFINDAIEKLEEISF
ncbi:MAG: ATP synthase F0 subunit B [Cyanobacteria bacterium SIG30]|nr:ATP synthase F0 subunit B [Cyanobacteria bacterium SIG30]